LTTGFIVQNLGSSTTTANLYFYDRSGGNPHGPYPISNIAPMESQGVYLSQVSAVSNGWTGAVKIVSSNGQPLAVMVQTDNSITTGKRYSYNAASTPSNTVVLPYAVKDVNGRTSSYVVMNTSSASKDINIKYFDTNGNPTGSSSGYTYTLAGYGSKGVNLTVEPMSDGWQGYIVITTEEGINSLVAILRDDTSNAGSACNGVPR
jgi:hypothetical protein